LLLGLGHIEREPEPHLTLTRMAGRLPGGLVDCNDRREFGHGGTNESHKQPEPHRPNGRKGLARGCSLV